MTTADDTTTEGLHRLGYLRVLDHRFGSDQVDRGLAHRIEHWALCSASKTIQKLTAAAMRRLPHKRNPDVEADP